MPAVSRRPRHTVHLPTSTHGTLPILPPLHGHKGSLDVCNVSQSNMSVFVLPLSYKQLSGIISRRIYIIKLPYSQLMQQIIIHNFYHGTTVLCLDLGRFFCPLILYTNGRTPWTGDQSVVRPLPTHRTTQAQNKRKQTSMPWLGFEPTIPVFERAKTFDATDRAATVIMQCWINVRFLNVQLEITWKEAVIV
jgi:hypothetical protein